MSIQRFWTRIDNEWKEPDMGGRSGGSFGKSARPKFEGGSGGVSRPRRLWRGPRPAMRGSLGAAAYRPDVIAKMASKINDAIRGLVS